MSPVQLAVLPEHKEHVIVCGTTVRKRADILRAYLASLAWQELPSNVRLHFVFVPDFTRDQADAHDALKAFVAEHGGELLRGVPAGVADFDDSDPVTHRWSQSAMQRVGANKNRILKRALELNADAVWLADADLVLDRTTLVSLVACDRPIVTAVYWSYWHRQGHETRKIHAAPQVWLKHPYGLDGRGMDEAEFRTRLIDHQLTKVPGYGACTLISRRALEAGVSFDYLPDVPPVGMMAGEDRHFCLRAERMHIDAWADPWPDIFHVFHAQGDVEQIPAMTARLGAAHPQRAALGDLVSLKLQPLEPVPHQTGWTMVQPQHIRGRLGALPLVPEIEEAVYGLDRGTKRDISVHFPLSYSIAYYRGKRRLVRVELVDCKPLGWAPVVENELYVGPRSGKWLDHVTLTAELHKGIAETHDAA